MLLLFTYFIIASISFVLLLLFTYFEAFTNSEIVSVSLLILVLLLVLLFQYYYLLLWLLCNIIIICSLSCAIYRIFNYLSIYLIHLFIYYSIFLCIYIYLFVGSGRG